jgi:hypothetical protein
MVGRVKDGMMEYWNGGKLGYWNFGLDDQRPIPPLPTHKINRAILDQMPRQA